MMRYLVALVVGFVALVAMAAATSPVSAAHNGADVDFTVGACGETAFTAAIVNPAGSGRNANGVSDQQYA